MQGIPRSRAEWTQQGRQDSNLQPPVLETGALPIELLPWVAQGSLGRVARLVRIARVQFHQGVELVEREEPVVGAASRLMVAELGQHVGHGPSRREERGEGTDDQRVAEIPELQAS